MNYRDCHCPFLQSIETQSWEHAWDKLVGKEDPV